MTIKEELELLELDILTKQNELNNLIDEHQNATNDVED